MSEPPFDPTDTDSVDYPDREDAAMYQALADSYDEKKWCPTCGQYETPQQIISRHYR